MPEPQAAAGMAATPADAGPWARANEWLGRGEAAVLVRVAQARGSTPREVGAWMLVGDRQIAGTIGGGRLEWQAIGQARAWLNRPDAPAPDHPAPHHPTLPWPAPMEALTLALGPSLGQCCGGSVTLHLHRLSDCAEALRLGAAACAHQRGAQGADSADAHDGWAVWPIPPSLPAQRLQLHGAGHVGQALAPLLMQLPGVLQWFDSREAPLPADAPAALHRLLQHEPDPVARVAEAASGSGFIVMTHCHALDFELVRAALARDDAAYVGLIGSQTKRARFSARLRARGWPESRLQRLVCPIGLPEIDGKTPQRIAMSVMAQLLQRAGQQRPNAADNAPGLRAVQA